MHFCQDEAAMLAAVIGPVTLWVTMKYRWLRAWLAKKHVA
jgi:hypothetical protein